MKAGIRPQVRLGIAPRGKGMNPASLPLDQLENAELRSRPYICAVQTPLFSNSWGGFCSLFAESQRQETLNLS